MKGRRGEWLSRVAAAPRLSDRWAYFAAALLLAVLVARVAYRLTPGIQTYPDLVVGNLAWSGAAKQPDFVVLLALVGGFVVGLTLLWGLAGWALERRGPAGAAALHHLFVMASVPGWIWLGSIVIKGSGELHLLWLGAVATALTAVSATMAIGRREEIDPDDLRAGVAASVVIVVLAVLTPAALAFAPGRAGPWLGWPSSSARWWLTRPVLGGAATLALLFVAAVWSPWSATVGDVRRRLVTALLLLQLPSLLFFLAIVPVPWSGPEGLAVSTRPSAQLWLVVALLVALGVADVRRRAVSPIRGWFGASLSPVVGVALLVLLKGSDAGQGFIPVDDYHFGEYVTPFWAWFDHGLIPYWDYGPARGLTDYTSGLLSTILFDGSAASFVAVTPVAEAMYWVVALPVLAWSLGVPGALVALLLMAPKGGIAEIDMLMTAALVILVETYRRCTPGLWLGIWALIGTAAVLLAPGQGGLLVLATTPLGAAALRPAWSTDRRRLQWAALAGGGAALVVLVGTPAGRMLMGAVRYGMEQSQLNTAAWGIAWVMNTGWLYEAARFSWIAVGMAAGAAVLLGSITREREERRAVLSWAGPIFLLCVLYVMRAAGRIDVGFPSRAGQASIWALALLAPLLVALVRSEPRRDVMFVAAVFAASVVAPSFGALRLSTLWQRPIATVTPDPTAVIGAEHGLPSLGVARMSPEHLARLIGVKRVLDRVVDPGETYLDVTNRAAQYFYFNLPPPIETGAFYNLIHGNQHLRAIRRLTATPPPIAVVDADNIVLDGSTVALRAYPLFRYLVDRYEPVEVDGRVYLVRPDRVDRIPGQSARTAVERADAKLELLDRVFLSGDLQGIPRSWGASFSHLRPRVREVARVWLGPPAPIGAATGVTSAADMTALRIGGDAAGLVLVQIRAECPGGAVPRFALSWSGDQGRASGRITFDGDPEGADVFLVPLDAQPRWLHATRIEGLTVELSSPPSCRALRVADARLYQRRIADIMRTIMD